jgi:hypothetical protein
MNAVASKPEPVKKDVTGPMILRAAIAPLFILGLLRSAPGAGIIGRPGLIRC